MVRIKKENYLKLQEKRRRESFIDKLNEYRGQYSEFGMFLANLFGFFYDSSDEAFSLANTYFVDFLFVLHPDLKDLHREAFNEDYMDNRTMFIPILPPFCESLWEKTKEFLDLIAPFAKDHGIVICMENLYESFGGHLVEGPGCDADKASSHFAGDHLIRTGHRLTLPAII